MRCLEFRVLKQRCRGQRIGSGREDIASPTCPAVLSSLSTVMLHCAGWGFGGGRTQLAGSGKTKREERLVKALRDNLRRRKAPLREAAKDSGESGRAAPPETPIESKQPS
jgi:hypothetical protein